MTRLATISVAAILIAVAGSPASASNCAIESFDHNGSVMEVAFCDYSLSISYDIPRKVMRRNGVRQGTLLVNARTSGGGHVLGSARIFKRGCGELKYKVEGRLENDRIVLRGLAPVRDDSCTVVRMRNDTLVFERN